MPQGPRYRPDPPKAMPRSGALCADSRVHEAFLRALWIPLCSNTFAMLRNAMALRVFFVSGFAALVYQILWIR